MMSERQGVAGKLRLGGEVEEDFLAAHVRIHLPHICPFMFVVLIVQSMCVRVTNQSTRLCAWYYLNVPFMSVVLNNNSAR
jgi:hypothetical protein